MSPPNALSPVRTTSVPPFADVQAMPDTTWVGRLSPIEVQFAAWSVDFQMPPFETAAYRLPLGSRANDVVRPDRPTKPSRVEPRDVS